MKKKTRKLTRLEVFLIDVTVSNDGQMLPDLVKKALDAGFRGKGKSSVTDRVSRGVRRLIRMGRFVKSDDMEITSANKDDVEVSYSKRMPVLV